MSGNGHKTLAHSHSRPPTACIWGQRKLLAGDTESRKNRTPERESPRQREAVQVGRYKMTNLEWAQLPSHPTSGTSRACSHTHCPVHTCSLKHNLQMQTHNQHPVTLRQTRQPHSVNITLTLWEALGWALGTKDDFTCTPPSRDPPAQHCAQTSG